MRIRWETAEGAYLGIGFWKDEPLYLGPEYDEGGRTICIIIMLLFGFLEIRLGR